MAILSMAMVITEATTIDHTTIDITEALDMFITQEEYIQEITILDHVLSQRQIDVYTLTREEQKQ